MKARGLVLAVCAAALLAIVQPAATARHDATLSDPQGDAQGPGVPDITLTTVSNSGAKVHFRIVTPNQAKLNPDSRLYLEIDTDRSPQTGGPDTLGSDYVFILTNTGYGFAHWTGVDWDFDTPYATVVVSNTNGGADIQVDRSELGNTSGFNFWIRGLQETETGNLVDDAPNDGTYSYALQALTAAIASVNVTFVPYPQAGKTFKVKVLHATLETGKSVKPDSTKCEAKVGAKRIRGSGAGGCTFRLPLSSRRKMFSVRVTVTYDGARKVAGPFAARIK